MGDALLFAAVFAACVVESVEALTILLAVGITRGWRATTRGALAAAVTLVAVVAVLGPALSRIPVDPLRLVVGGLLLVFGLGWLRKAVLRAAGLKALHDETAIYERERTAADTAPPVESSDRGWLVDPYAFTLAFKAVLLEGLEVVFIVLTFGANQHNTGLAALAAAAAVVVVAAAGAAVRGPLARIPENTLKLAVGTLLTAFGTFWGVEGAGGDWPGADLALLLLIAWTAVLALGCIAVLRHRQPTASTGSTGSTDSTAGRPG